MHPGEHLCISGRLKDQRSPSEYVLGPAIDPHAKRRKRTGLSFTSHNHSVNTQTLVPSSIKHQASSIKHPALQSVGNSARISLPINTLLRVSVGATVLVRATLLTIHERKQVSVVSVPGVPNQAKYDS